MMRRSLLVLLTLCLAASISPHRPASADHDDGHLVDFEPGIFGLQQGLVSG
jgi:hypothetical protein